jgi:hypothetical protein
MDYTTYISGEHVQNRGSGDTLGKTNLSRIFLAEFLESIESTIESRRYCQEPSGDTPIPRTRTFLRAEFMYRVWGLLYTITAILL